MTGKEQKKFVAELIDNVKVEIEAKLGKIPDHWDGIELRWLIRDSFSAIVFSGYTDRRSKRYKEYANTVIIENLI